MNRSLVAYRKLLGLKQEDLAKKLSITLTSYSYKETGKKQFNQSEMIEITKIFKERIPDITMDHIFFEEKVSLLVTNMI